MKRNGSLTRGIDGGGRGLGLVQGLGAEIELGIVKTVDLSLERVH